jgi:hypothetical protein
MTKPPRVRIPEKDLQNKFNRNEGGYPAQISILQKRCVYDEPASPKSNQVPGTRSLVIQYYNAVGERVLTTHHFLKPDGTLGGRGKIDPKELLVDGIMYFK